MCISSRMAAVCQFMDKYVAGLYGCRSIVTWITKNKGKHFLDMVTMSDIAYTVAVIENSYEAWNEEHGIGEEQEVNQRAQKTVKAKFTNRVGKKRQCNMSGWSTEGIQFYNKVRDSWRALTKETTWTTLDEEWAKYEEKTNFGHSSRRKKDEHEEPEDDYYDGGDQCPNLPQLWDKFVLLEGDEEFIDERPTSKRMRGLNDQDGGDSDDDDIGGHQGRLSRVSMSWENDSDGDGDGDSDGEVRSVRLA